MIKIKVGIIGATGYAGAELVRLLRQRDDIEIVSLGSRSYAGTPFSDEYGSLRGYEDDDCCGEDMAEMSENVDVIFTATPQGFCASQLTEEILASCKVIDLSADFRITDPDIYEQWYKIHHPCPGFIKEAVYGLPEINREKIKSARLIANPGCYPTCSFLSIYPLLKAGYIDIDSIIIDAKSGTTGAGSCAKTHILFFDVNESA